MPRPSENRGLPAIATGSPRSLVVPRSSLRVRGTRRVTEGPSGIRSGERGSLRRVGVVLFELVSKVIRGYLTPWLDSSQVRRVHGGGADWAGPARLLGRWDHSPERTDRLGRSAGVTFAGAQVGTGSEDPRVSCVRTVVCPFRAGPEPFHRHRLRNFPECHR